MKTMKRFWPVAFMMVGVLTFTLGGCATENYNAQTYQTGLVAQQVELGTIVSIQPVVLQQQSSSQIGGAVGTVGGAVLGSQLGGASRSPVPHVLGALGGAVLGGLAGQSVGGQMGQQTGLLVTVRLNNGKMIAITQQTSEGLYVGQQVQVLFSPTGHDRVVPMQ